MSKKTPFYLSSLLRSYVSMCQIPQVRQTHAQIIVHGFLFNLTLQTDLLLAYSKCGSLPHARQMFDKMPERSMHSWNILIFSYVQHSMFSVALDVFANFRQMGLRPDHYTLPPLYKACAGIGDEFLGRLLYGWVIKLGLDGYVVVSSSFLDFCIKCGCITDAKRVFSYMSCKDSVAWSLMISGFGRAGLYRDSLNCFREMLVAGVKIDAMTIPSVLNACGGDGDLIKGKEIHGRAIKNRLYDTDVAIGNSLIDMYSKCGCLDDAEKVFRSMNNINLVTWTTMISCYGVHGKGEDSLLLFKKMIGCGFTPNPITLTAVLASCSHSGMIDEGRGIFNSIRLVYGLEPSVEHYACLVDLLGRFGYLDEALGLVKNMQTMAPASVWGALLAGCMMHKNVEIGEIAANRLFELEPRNSSNYIALCSIYDSLSLWDGVAAVRAKMKELGLVKTPGCSWITIYGTVHKFYQGDHSHPSTLLIYETLHRMVKVASLASDF
ncbi:pentatricopeptide repeat-containing protein At5g04780, mitochondrial-like [Humulus lupulus]|uniref:pentatricopeptide repeat-containing protein At5g04780, mitochondrial-like n=1 Tax=Humulus lupulus TaxID=3486 RepID=UPI002B40BC2B|nr:pentatricopeptide repeat-containing protein At5g04780, mitochondrial-like [Humulus lupulus]XP_062078403.1 pentatricopeptide repeat-containing protein At5g04780, mitochondrial-like [Humulus lupulus]